MKNTENKSITGLDVASNRKEAEYDLVQALLTAMDYSTDSDNVTEAEIKRNGKYLFSVHLHPISDRDIQVARKKATIYMPNPNGKKLPPIEKDFDITRMKCMVIYLATTEEDQQKIWGNPTVMQKAQLQERHETVNALLSAGEVNRLFELVQQISGLDDDEDENDQEEYAKN